MQGEPVKRRGRPPSPVAAAAIVEAATVAFLKNGFAATTMQSIARDFGGSKKTIYARFEDKRALFKAVLVAFTQRRLAEPRNIDPSEPLDVVLAKLASALLRAALDPQTLQMQRLVIAEADREPELADLLFKHATMPARSLVWDLLNHMVQEGRIKGDPDDLCRFFMDLTVTPHMSNAMVHPMPPISEVSFAASQKNAIEFFLRGCRSPNDSSR